MHFRRILPRMDRLERRLVLSGNVTAVVNGGSLLLTGDAQDNTVVLEQSTPGSFIVSGGFSDTTINGGTDPVPVSGVTRDVRFAAGGGFDQLQFQHADFFSPVVVGRDLIVSGAARATNEVTITANTPLDVGRDVTYTGGNTTDRSGLFGTVHVARNVTFNNGGGNNETNVSSFSEPSTVGGNVTINNGNGTHTNFVVDTFVGGDVSFINGNAPEGFGGTRNTFGRSSAFENVTVGGSVTFITGSGPSESDLDETDVAGNVNIVAGGEASIEVGATSPSATSSIGGSLTISATGGDAEVSAGGVGFRRAGTLTVGRNLNIATGNGDDVVTLNLLTVNGSSNVGTGGGADDVVIDDSTFAAFSLNTGGGDDELKVESISGEAIDGPITVFGSVNADLGAGNDRLQLGVAGDPTRRVRLVRSSRFNGGSGTDFRDDANVDAPNGVIYTSFEQVAPPPLLLGPVRYQVGEYVLSVETADVNNDGVLDIVTVNQDSGTASVLLGNGDGTFQPQIEFSAGSNPEGLAIADFNGDGNLDLAIADNQSNRRSINVHLGNGDGTFAPFARFVIAPAGTLPVRVAAGDVNGDGKIDLVSVNRTGTTSTSVAILLGNGDGTFGAGTLINLGANSGGSGTDVKLGDVSGDGKVDIVASTTRGYAVLLGDGAGAFAVQPFRTHSPITLIELADLDGDADLDLVSGGNSLSVHLNDGTGMFGTSSIVIDEGVTGVDVGDITGDGKADLVAGHFGGDDDVLAVVPGNGDGTFGAPINFSPGPDDGPVALGDLDGDGLLDVVIGNQEFQSVAVFLNNGA
jgi:hypothetical protein